MKSKICSTYIIIIIAIYSMLIIGCGNDDEGEAILNLQFKFAPGISQQAEITRVVVTISGADIDTQEFELKVDGRKATGVIAVPAGEERTIKVKAYAGNVVEFEGEAFVDHPKPGTEIPITIQLKPVSGNQKEEKIFEIGNIYAVDNSPTSPSVFVLSKPHFITQIITYHWNYAKGATPGTISLTDSNRKTYGPWQAVGADGQGGVKNAYWIVKPNIELPAGTYTVIDSDPSTWAQNFGSNGQGFVTVYGYPTDSGTNDNLSPVIYGNDGMQMMLIPAGEFVMGSNKGESFEKPEHTVYLDAFYMDIYEVTNAQYQEFVRATGRKEPVGLSFNIYDLSESPKQGFRPWQDNNFNGYKQPVVCISYDDAQAYAKWAGKRLPTEAEWEKVARNKRSGQDFSWGNTWPPPNRVANFRDESFKRLTKSTETIISNFDDGYAYTSPAGEYAPNAYGISDIDGNVAELCADWVGSDYYSISPKRNPTGPSTGTYRVFRGSGFLSVDRDMIRIFSRFSFDPNSPMFFIGFRCVKDAK